MLDRKAGQRPSFRLAGIVHDIGKIHVPDALLYKPGLLTAEEYEIVKSHAAWGAKIVEPLKVIAIERIVRHHHERYDGQGYPDKLKGEEIPPGARIIAVANAFHAMVSALPYRKARSAEEALAELRRCRGTQFDPWWWMLSSGQSSPLAGRGKNRAVSTCHLEPSTLVASYAPSQHHPSHPSAPASVLGNPTVDSVRVNCKDS